VNLHGHVSGNCTAWLKAVEPINAFQRFSTPAKMAFGASPKNRYHD
jgi:hypothetical protein